MRSPALAAASCVVGRVAHHDHVAGRDVAEPGQGGPEDVRLRLGLLGVVGRGLGVGEPLDVGDPLVGLELVGLGRGRQHDARAIGPDALEQRAHVGERPDPAEVALLQDLAPALVERLALLVQLLPAQEHRHELVAALADLPADRVERHVAPDLPERVDPGLGVEVDGVDQRSVHVEDDSLDHREPPLRAGNAFAPPVAVHHRGRAATRERWFPPGAGRHRPPGGAGPSRGGPAGPGLRRRGVPCRRCSRTGSFLKNKKILLVWLGTRFTFGARWDEVFLLLFLQKKEALPVFDTLRTSGSSAGR